MAAALAHLGGTNPLESLLVREHFRAFVLTGLARRRVREILRTGSELAWCAARSNRHFNDFDKIVLQETGHGRRLVWHRWADPVPPEGSAPEPHNHRWDFLSYVAAGTLDAVDYLVRDDPDGPYHRHLYRSPGTHDSYTMEPAGRAALIESGRSAHRSGSFYYQPYQRVHLAMPSAPATDTLILQGDVRSLHTEVYSLAGGGQQVERPVTRLGVSELRTVLESAVELLPSG